MSGTVLVILTEPSGEADLASFSGSSHHVLLREALLPYPCPQVRSSLPQPHSGLQLPFTHIKRPLSAILALDLNKKCLDSAWPGQ